MTRMQMYGFAAVAIFCAFLAGFNVILNNRSSSLQSKVSFLEQQHTSDLRQKRLAITLSYERCVAGIPTITKIDEFIRGTQEFDLVLAQNGEATHEATLPGSDTYRTQTKNLARLLKALKKESGLSNIPVPTAAICLQEEQSAIKEVGE